ncbi:hypothetical protein BAUCODRAFT_217006 [Baudoinia panamericana UAMH 10762]|uniref:Uncharacterized protein n=1 Tax=Baudoinia panamericana (strain UAMH 10762) TaxID=717646 RepID=M2N5D6_BAUPA|nr:uncharacterized protein BAUCODRAFT_217006 [Baudoinia panamericana UAMH 10762]EMC93975.1 hypothetical protein BAUCODRAFT_217006 [Baudoinia panamericana UAMH 10762]
MSESDTSEVSMQAKKADPTLNIGTLSCDAMTIEHQLFRNAIRLFSSTPATASPSSVRVLHKEDKAQQTCSSTLPTGTTVLVMCEGGFIGVTP